jgi:hypothetical protein
MAFVRFLIKRQGTETYVEVWMGMDMAGLDEVRSKNGMKAAEKTSRKGFKLVP